MASIDAMEPQADIGAPRTVAGAWARATPGFAAVVLFSVVINICRLATPLFVLQALDRVMSSGSLETLLMLAIFTLAAIVTEMVLGIIRRRMFINLGSWIERAFGPRLARAALMADGRSGKVSASGALQDLGVVRGFVASSALIHWIDIVWAPVFAIIVFLIHPILASLVLVWMALALAVGLAHDMLTREPRNASRQAKAAARRWIDTAERHSETIRANGMGGDVAQHWMERSDERLDESDRMRSRSATAHSTMVFLRRGLRLVLIAAGIWLALEGELTLGAVMACSVLGRNAFSAVEKAIMRLRDLSLARAAYKRLGKALSVESAPVSMARDGVEGPLGLSNLSYRYPHRAASVVRDVNVTVKPGQTLAFHGPSASGKTTLCRIVSGQLAPRDGQARLGDLDLSRMPAELAASSIGYLPQTIMLFPGTVRVNIARMGEGDFDDVVAAAKLAGIHDAILRLPEGYDTHLGAEDQAHLSAGEHKAIALARAYYRWPRLLVLDEPEPHLDRRLSRALETAVEAFKERGSIVVFATQSRKTARAADITLELSPTSNRARRSKGERGAGGRLFGAGARADRETEKTRV